MVKCGSSVNPVIVGITLTVKSRRENAKALMMKHPTSVPFVERRSNNKMIVKISQRLSKQILTK